MQVPLWVLSALVGAAAGFVLLIVIALTYLGWKLTSAWKGVDIW